MAKASRAGSELDHNSSSQLSYLRMVRWCLLPTWQV